jgi:hypothetical protein
MRSGPIRRLLCFVAAALVALAVVDGAAARRRDDRGNVVRTFFKPAAGERDWQRDNARGGGGED